MEVARDHSWSIWASSGYSDFTGKTRIGKAWVRACQVRMDREGDESGRSAFGASNNNLCRVQPFSAKDIYSFFPDSWEILIKFLVEKAFKNLHNLPPLFESDFIEIPEKLIYFLLAEGLLC
jgi:hypothetical protein